MMKVEHTAGFGAEVILTARPRGGSRSPIAWQEHGLAFIHPYDDPRDRRPGHDRPRDAGQAPDLDCLVVPIGGGGLISGIAVAAKALKPSSASIGVQAALFPRCTTASRAASLPMRGDTLAEGIAVKAPGT